MIIFVGQESKFDDAIVKYSEAIRLKASPVFHCNRAAAYTKMERYEDALGDCRAALRLDHDHSKAYARMGLVSQTFPFLILYYWTPCKGFQILGLNNYKNFGESIYHYFS